MYRVELKGGVNKPVGPKSSSPFLMYRVELKVFISAVSIRLTVEFLMYRVELKEVNPGKVV